MVMAERNRSKDPNDQRHMAVKITPYSTIITKVTQNAYNTNFDISSMISFCYGTLRFLSGLANPA